MKHGPFCPAHMAETPAIGLRIASYTTVSSTLPHDIGQTCSPPSCVALPRPAPHSYGYDPLGLGKDKETVEKYRANELIHARWAMLAAAGIIIPEGLQVRGCVVMSCLVL